MAWRNRLAGPVARHNRRVTEFKTRARAAKTKIKEGSIDLVLAQASVHNLRSYKLWLVDAVVKIGQHVERRCGAALLAGDLPDDVRRRCDSVPLDGAGIDPPPCTTGTCAAWDKYFRR
jgi:hypothetical protein